MCFLKYVLKLLVIIGALDLGVMGVANYDVLGNLFGGMDLPMLTHSVGVRIVYVIIGIAGLISLICVLKSCCSCNDKNKKDKGHHGGGCCR
ncbi:MAG: DUF378 domain-containing protein [Chlamydiae bacterium]|jgi:uncharacterized membrane protein YuzA (DUF378 family)|nr:DUF378 domain-containing protein [Chlamydiota bacterium]